MAPSTSEVRTTLCTRCRNSSPTWSCNDLFDDGYTPETVLCREDEFRRYSEALQDIVDGVGPNNVFIYGQTGNGRTVVTKKMMSFPREETAYHDISLTILEVKCNKDDSIFNVLISLINQLRPPEDHVPEQGPTNGFRWSTLYEELDQLEGDVGLLVGGDVGQPVERGHRYPGVFRRRAGSRLDGPLSGV